ncbi:holin-associated N-acetylmuramidase [Phaeobacter sp. QD34_3]|uniref:holin-associated N-acetylmuramidase n=1 Tax=unclassified Phaeobacter TaxID=2621772 RepID=UPI00237F35B9|nr:MULTISPECIES: holin-associated N-acetylmuramidase [unclassified Phaeobacter]MDE4131646.1 holin-associated N-acetylmuramidase [Phaeobacter sp. QD34_3]MDE4135265.1 holin-associated N-acetylmuramidase [Phaeobacter sp. QD34_24]
MQVTQIAEEIVDREGDYVNDPDDPGGATKFGVTIHTLRRLGLDLTGDGQVGLADVKALSREQAVEIFVKEYFERPGLHRLPHSLQDSVFDMYVNAGSNAIRILQRLLVQMGYDAAVDGVMGPQTAAAAHRAARVDASALRDAYGIARRSYYFDLADRRPASRKYARTRAGNKGGWIRRAEAFMSDRYHMDAAQFRARVADWER